MKIIISLIKRCDLDITSNSHDYPTKKSMVLVRRMNSWILGMKGFLTLQQRFHLNMYSSVSFSPLSSSFAICWFVTLAITLKEAFKYMYVVCWMNGAVLGKKVGGYYTMYVAVSNIHRNIMRSLLCC